MKKRIGFLLVLCLLVVSLLMPMAKVNVPSSVDPAEAALFPSSITLLNVLLKGTAALPTSSISALSLAQLGQSLLIAGCVTLVLAAVAACLKRRGCLQLSIALSVASCAMFFGFATRVNNTAGSLLFGYLLEVQFWVWVPAVLALLMGLLGFLTLTGETKAVTGGSKWADMEKTPALPLNDGAWRRLSALFAVLAAVCLLLPYIVVSVPEGITDSVSAGTINRSVSMLTYALDQEGTLNADVVAAGESTDVLTGQLGVLNAYSNQSASNNNIKYIFQNPKATTTSSVWLLASAALLVIGAVLALVKKTDRWFAVCCHALATVAAAAACFEMISVSSGDFYAKAGRQLVYLGLGRVTVVPLAMMVLSAAALLCGMMGIRRANEPYFINPLPQKMRIRVIAAALAVLALISLFLPSATFTFYKAGGTSSVSTADLTGVDGLTFSASDDVLHPKDKKGKTMYEEEPAKEGVLSSTAVEAAMKRIAVSNGVCTWLAVALTVAGLFLLLTGRARKATMACFGAGFLVRALQWLLLTVQMSSQIGESSGTLYLYVSMPLLVFAAFFSAFAHLEEVPKKYRLFLMMLPFLVSVFLFSYLPLVGWRYAFYNYKFGLPWSQQEFVGFKWFTEMFTNAGHFGNIVRVMKNTLGMSLLGLAFSWLPMFFAIFLNEINSIRFRKFVQIFTTLPNFISWALVFSFAMAMFSMETGIFSKFMLAIGAIDTPVAWLNSGDHIWLKMWAWGTWKGLGWSSIMYLAAIAGIDQEMYEAARVDGANRWNVIRHITLPSLLPTFFVLLLLSISNIINNGMEQYLVFQNAMNKETIEVLDLYVYNITIASKGTTMYSFGTAIGILKTIVSVTLLFTANFASKKLRGESIV